VPEKLPTEQMCKYIIDEMAAASYSSDVLETMQTPSPAPVIRFDRFQKTQSNFNNWLSVWRMIVSETNPNVRDIFNFARENGEKFTKLVKESLSELKNVKIEFGLEVKFAIERDGET